MRNDKHLAAKLRRAGKSYNYISKELLVPKSTLSYWFSHTPWSKKIKVGLEEKARWIAKKRLLRIIETRNEMWREWREGHRIRAIKEFPKLKNDPLFLAGVMLYWSEGDNGIRGGNARLTNTDPRMVKTFINFGLKVCKIPKEKIKIGLILYPDIKEKRCKTLWSKYLDIPENQFHKTQFIKGYHPTKRLANGICMVRIGGVEVKEKIKTWINLFSNNFCGSSSMAERLLAK